MRIAALVASLGLPSGTVPAWSQTPPSHETVRGGMVDASSPATLAGMMAAIGYAAEAGSDPAAGTPLIRGRIGQSAYTIHFYECDGARFCNSVQFEAQGPRPPDTAFDRINAFNARWRYVRAVDDGATLRLLMDVNLDAGVTAANFEDTLDIWRQLLARFERDLLNVR
jgi:hypothetical protein